MTLLGPADADRFRVTEGRFAERWYHDPLPPCPLNPTPVDQRASVPSATTIKKAAFAKDWSWLTIRDAAAWVADNIDTVAGIAAHDIDAAQSAIADGVNARKQAKMQRGSEVHELFETIGKGGDPHALAPLLPDGRDYLDAVVAFCADHVAEWIAVEAVAIGDGYAGTVDAIVRLADGSVAIVDWKSRAAGARHGAYPEDAVQVGAYASANYLIVEGDGGAERIPVEVDAGYVVSVLPDGARVYPVDLDVAAAEWAEAVARFHRHREIKLCGRSIELPKVAGEGAAHLPPGGGGGSRVPQPSPPTPLAGIVARRQWVRDRVATIRDAGGLDALLAEWPAGVPMSADECDDHAIDGIAEACAIVESALGLAFPPSDPASPPASSEPPPEAPVASTVRVAGDDERVMALRQRYSVLPEDLRAWTDDEARVRRGIPRLVTGRATEAQVVEVESIFDTVEAEWSARQGIALELLADCEEPERLLKMATAGREDRSVATLTEDELDLLDALVTLGRLGLVDREGDPTDDLVDRLGGRRAILTAGREAARVVGSFTPRSADDVIANPPLLAVVAKRITNNDKESGQ